MKLRDLDASFVVLDGHGFRLLDTPEGAQGLIFQCPKCAIGKERGEEDGRRFVVGAHSVICWFRNPRGVDPVSDDERPGPGRWEFTGTSIDDISFVGPGAASVHLTKGCGWHGFIRNGEALT